MAERIEYLRAVPKHPVSVLGALLGVTRFVVVVPLLLVGTMAVLGMVLVPVRVRGVRLALWAAQGLTRLFLALFGVRIHCENPTTIRDHQGLIFINHVSYIDPLILLALTPSRFLSTAGVKSMPFIGWMAAGVGTIFVNRGDDDSRAASRTLLVETLAVNPYPPVALAPEGQIGPGRPVLPFRHGALEVAAEADVPILPVVLDFDPIDAVAWLKGEWIPRAVWRIAARTSPVRVRVTVLPPLRPRIDTDVAILAQDLEAAYNRILGA